MFASPPLQQWKQLTSTGGPSPFTTAAQAPLFSCKKSAGMWTRNTHERKKRTKQWMNAPLKFLTGWFTWESKPLKNQEMNRSFFNLGGVFWPQAASAAAAAAAESAAARERAGMKETPIWSKENDVFGGKGLVFWWGHVHKRLWENCAVLWVVSIWVVVRRCHEL